MANPVVPKPAPVPPNRELPPVDVFVVLNRPPDCVVVVPNRLPGCKMCKHHILQHKSNVHITCVHKVNHTIGQTNNFKADVKYWTGTFACGWPNMVLVLAVGWPNPPKPVALALDVAVAPNKPPDFWPNIPPVLWGVLPNKPPPVGAFVVVVPPKPTKTQKINIST